MKRTLLAALAALLCACAAAPAHNPLQSWDQANLKRNDSGCPTAIFVAPDGNLSQCEMVEQKSDPPKFFPSADAAALYVVTKIYEHSHYYEYGGVIGKGPKGYALSAPTTLHHGTDVTINEDPDSYSFPIVATYHVHPCLRHVVPSVFSPQDLAGARTTSHPAYVLDECTGALHYWAPGDGYLSEGELLELGISPIELRNGVLISPGKIVGKILVDGAVIN
jgi:hypothetical protein